MTQRRRITTQPAVLSASQLLDLASQTKPRAPNPGDFKPGNKMHVGRKMRGPNKNTAIMREAVILAMQDCAKGLLHKRGLPYSGVVGYLTWAARQEPAAFLSFVAKAVLPVQIKHDLGIDQVVEVRFRRLEEVRMEFHKRGLPLPTLTTFQLEHHAHVDDAEPEPPRLRHDAVATPPAPERARADAPGGVEFTTTVN